MKLNSNTLLIGITLILLFSCKNQTEEFNQDYLVGKWLLYDGTTTVDGIQKKTLTMAEPTKYEFKKNGKVFMYGNEKGKLTWEITNDKNLILNNPYSKSFEYEPIIESQSKMTLNIKLGNQIISSFYERGWSE